jgi:hypothetical protein
LNRFQIAHPETGNEFAAKAARKDRRLPEFGLLRALMGFHLI